ncbi:MAG: type II toxin-antitoxin system RelE/ParE family toxin [Planctomycetaceae bacterium]|nr:type II toxin-antitoxin system RelE/ParE family toxin [Planctomycetaceae bacterium]
MTYRAEADPQATVDVEEAFAYLAGTSIDVARRFVEAVADAIVMIQHDPTIGMRWESQQPRLKGMRWKRIRGFAKYLVFYRVEARVVKICRVLHGSRDLHNIL